MGLFYRYHVQPIKTLLSRAVDGFSFINFLTFPNMHEASMTFDGHSFKDLYVCPQIDLSLTQNLHR